MATKRKEGLAALTEKEPIPSIQEITMLDWYAAFAMLRVVDVPEGISKAAVVFNMAEAMMAERKGRL